MKKLGGILPTGVRRKNMKIKKYRHFIGDFETTVFPNQEYTEVWASAVVELGSEDVTILHSIDETLYYLTSLKSNIIIYYHNLKFDGNFWLSYLLTKLKWKQAYDGEGDKVVWQRDKDMKNKTFKYTISDMGQWYTITLKVNGYFIEIRDSLKILPLSVKKIGKSFKTKHQKLDMDYEGLRYAGCPITDEEKEYIKNDVLVVKEAMEMMYDMGHTKMTIGSNCLSEYKSICNKSLNVIGEFDQLFPNLYDVFIDEKVHGTSTVGDWIRKSYKGGWCYLVEGKEGKIYHDGITADVNSLYPSMMHSESGNRYPVGYPHFWQGDYIPDEAMTEDKYFFIRVKTRFYVKEGYLPFIQIKTDPLYEATECLKDSDFKIKKKVKGVEVVEKVTELIDEKTGNIRYARPEITMTEKDFFLFRQHYNLAEFEILDGCYFSTMIGIFDEYIDKYKKIKQENDGGIREIAKLFLNNLYGKMSSSMDSSFKVASVDENGVLKFKPVVAYEKTPGYIPVGSAITSYSRCFTISAAQDNYYGVNKRGFIYADTDSIHCDLSDDEIKGIKIHDKNFCCWKIESHWDKAIFSRQKTYIEHCVEGDKSFNNIKCAGMPEKCKSLFELSMSGKANINGYIKSDILADVNEHPEAELEQWTEEEKEFLFDGDKPIVRDYSNFVIGLKVPDKLSPKRIRGGILLTNTTYEMR